MEHMEQNYLIITYELNMQVKSEITPLANHHLLSVGSLKSLAWF